MKQIRKVEENIIKKKINLLKVFNFYIQKKEKKNGNNNNGYYKCYDSYCNARASYLIKDFTKEINNNNIKKINIDSNNENYFSLSKEHTIEYNKHSYIKYDIIKKGMLNLNKNNLINDLMIMNIFQIF